MKGLLGVILLASLLMGAATPQGHTKIDQQFVTWVLHHPGHAHIYDGVNKGVIVGNCGFELVGHPGPFCNVD